MSIPKPEYYSLVNGLVVNFYDLTTNIPTSWLWDFGDSTTSTLQNPTKTYALAGIYNVRLTSTNADGSQDVIKIVFVSTIPTELGIGIDEFVKINLPSTLTLIPTIIPTLKKKWQLMLYEAVSPQILDANIYNEAQWPDIWNLLISYCIIYDILLILSQESLIGSFQLDSSNTSGSTNSNSASGGLKRLVEGPSEAEWFDLSSQLTNMFKANPDGSTSFSMMTAQACAIASKLRVKLPFCPAINVPTLFVITDKPCHTPWTN